MLHSCNIRTVRAALGALLLILTAACADVPSGPTRPTETRPSSRIADDPDQVEVLGFRSHLVASGTIARSEEFSVTTHRGVAMVEGWRLGAAPGDAVAPVALRVWDRGARGVSSVRRSRSTLRLADGQVAIIERESLADGTPTTMRVRVGEGEFVWTRAWVRRDGRNALVSSAVESRFRGVVVGRSVVNVQSRRFVSARVGRTDPASRYLLAMSRRFGSIAGTVLLPRALQAQSDGMVCSGAATALNAAWTAWRIATVSWFVSMALGGVAKTTAVELTASAAVDVAEANYIDCYVAATAAGVPDYRIAQPPAVDEL